MEEFKQQITIYKTLKTLKTSTSSLSMHSLILKNKSTLGA